MTKHRPSGGGRARHMIVGLLLGGFAVTSVLAATPADVQALLKKGELSAALETAEAGLDKDTDNIELRFLKGLVLTRMERFDAAEKVFESLIEQHPNLPEPYNNLAVVHAAQGDYDKAREALLRAINTHPSYATAYENIGDIYAKMASDAYNQALQLDTQNTAAREKLSLVNDLFSAEQAAAAAAPAPQAGPAPSATVNAQEPGPAKPTAEMPGPVMSGSDPGAGAEEKPSSQKAAEKDPAAKKATAESGPEPKQVDTDVVVQAVRDWAAAWSRQDVETYLNAYADSFLPPAGMSREDWHSQRRERLNEPEYIRVGIDDVRVNTLGPDHVQVRFRQDYQSNTYSDNVIKTLLMKRDGDRWLIAEEYSG